MTPEQAAVIEAAKKWAEARDKCYGTVTHDEWDEFRESESELLAAVAALRQAERKEAVK